PLPPSYSLVPFTSLFRSLGQTCRLQVDFRKFVLDLFHHGVAALQANLARAAVDLGANVMLLPVLRPSGALNGLFHRHQHLIRLRSEEHTSELQSRENLVC